MSRLLQCNDKNKDAFTCIAVYQWDCINRFIFNDSIALKYVYMSMPETLIYVCMIYETTRTICISWRWFSCKQRLCWQSQSKTFLKLNCVKKTHQETGTTETLPLFLLRYLQFLFDWSGPTFTFSKSYLCCGCFILLFPWSPRSCVEAPVEKHFTIHILIFNELVTLCCVRQLDAYKWSTYRSLINVNSYSYFYLHSQKENVWTLWNYITVS